MVVGNDLSSLQKLSLPSSQSFWNHFFNLFPICQKKKLLFLSVIYITNVIKPSSQRYCRHFCERTQSTWRLALRRQQFLSPNQLPPQSKMLGELLVLSLSFVFFFPFKKTSEKLISAKIASHFDYRHGSRVYLLGFVFFFFFFSVLGDY